MSRLPDLEGMDRDALLALWSTTFGGGAPARLSQPLLRRVLAWELQAKEQGGLPAGVRKRLEALATASAKAATPKVKTGGRFLREWNGVTHVVDVVEGGYFWKGERHRSLSAIAHAITGAHWSGPRFFGLGESSEAVKAKKPQARSAEHGAKKADNPKAKMANSGKAKSAQVKQTTPARAGRRAA